MIENQKADQALCLFIECRSGWIENALRFTEEMNSDGVGDNVSTLKAGMVMTERLFMLTEDLLVLVSTGFGGNTDQALSSGSGIAKESG